MKKVIRDTEREPEETAQGGENASKSGQQG